MRSRAKGTKSQVNLNLWCPLLSWLIGSFEQQSPLLGKPNPSNSACLCEFFLLFNEAGRGKPGLQFLALADAEFESLVAVGDSAVRVIPDVCREANLQAAMVASACGFTQL